MRYWYVESHAYHQDGSSANYQSTAEVSVTEAKGTHGLVLTMARGLSTETFTVTVVLHCTNKFTVIYSTTVTLTKKTGPCRLTSPDFKLMLTPSQSLLNKIKASELPGGRLAPKYQMPYNDAAPASDGTPRGHCTIGWGHLIHYGPCDGSASETGAARDASGYKTDYAAGISAAKAQAIFDKDVADRAAIMRSKVNFDLNQNQYDALFDLFFNHGYGCKTGGCWSPDDLIEAINCGDFPHVLKLMATFVYSDGKRDEGLAARRAADAKLFQQPVGNPRRRAAGPRTSARIARSSPQLRAHARKRAKSAGILAANLRRATSGRVVTVRGSRWGARAGGCSLVHVTAFAVGVTPYPARIVGRTSKRAFVLRWQTPGVSGQYDWLVQATQKCGGHFRVAHATVNLKPAALPPATRRR